MKNVKIITPQTLRNWMKTGKEISIIDVRPIHQWQESFIPFSIYFNAYNQLKINDSDAFKGLHLEKNIPVIVLCAGGKISLIGAEILQNQGYDSYSLEGGINEWNSTSKM